MYQTRHAIRSTSGRYSTNLSGRFKEIKYLGKASLDPVLRLRQIILNNKFSKKQKSIHELITQEQRIGFGYTRSYLLEPCVLCIYQLGPTSTFKTLAFCQPNNKYQQCVQANSLYKRKNRLECFKANNFVILYDQRQPQCRFMYNS